ncbi:MAG: hypothetical protein M3O77_05115 [Chloroflexota bacterium]|nr:hypothetical protein [Chloroflexota bacterium]
MTTDLEPGFQSLGQATARAIATRGALNDRLQRSLLVNGPAGAGKDAFVDDLLALLFCLDPDRTRRPCNSCRGCGDARARVHPDLVVGSPERWREGRSAAESIVSVARRWLLEASGAPIVADRRIVLIEHADVANEQTQNALLKALEEPTARHMFILVADEPSRLLPTVRSRCQPLRIGRVPRLELVDWLMDRHRVAADQADALARLSGGLSGVALAYVRDPEGIAWQRRAQAELLALLERGLADRFGSVRELLDDAGRQASPVPDEATAGNEEGESPRAITAVQRQGAQRLTAAWLELSRDLLMVSVGRPDLASAAELVPGLPGFARGIGPGTWVDFIGLLERIHEGLRESGAPRLAMEVAMLEWPSLASR